MAKPHRARKRFGQHFLTDRAVIESIARAVAPQPGDLLAEIGPGLQALTAPLLSLLPAPEKMAVVELDRDLALRLRSNNRLLVVQQDALKVDFAQLLADLADWSAAQPASQQLGQQSERQPAERKLRVVGNLPYNISTPLLFHLSGFAEQIQDQTFMLQKEVVERMVAAPATAAYGRLSVMLQWRYAMHHVLDVPPEAFDPPPRVMSAVLVMRPRPAAELRHTDADTLSELMRVAFSQRRKLLRHTLGKWLEQRGYAGSFDLQRRAEEVAVNDWLTLCAQLTASSDKKSGNDDNGGNGDIDDIDDMQ